MSGFRLQLSPQNAIAFWGSPEAVTEVVPAVEVVKEVVKPRKTRSKKAPQPKLQPISVGAAAVDYAAMTSEQLRKECALQGINW